MIITKLSLKNFGIFESAEYDFKSGIVGIFGPSGAGKSVMMQAIKYAITGDLDDTANTYIRYFDENAKRQPGAEIILEFTHNGIPGRIRRGITKTSSTRHLVYGEVDTEEAAKMSETIREIVGAELQTVASAAFIPQGVLDSMLFGTTATREDLFVRLLNVGFIEKLGTKVAAAAAKLSSMIIDRGPEIQRLQESASVEKSRREELQIKLNLIRKPDLQHIETARQYCGTLSSLRKDMEPFLYQQGVSKTAVQAALDNDQEFQRKKTVERDALQLRLLEVVDEAAKMSQAAAEKNSLLASLNDAYRAYGDYTQARASLETFNATPETVKGICDERNFQERKIGELMALLTQKEKATKDVAAASASMIQASQHDAELRTQLNARLGEKEAKENDLAENEKAHEKKIYDTTEDRRMLEITCSLQVSHIHDELTKCPFPLCGAHLSATRQQVDAAIATAKAKLASINAEIGAFAQRSLALKNELKLVENQISDLNSKIVTNSANRDRAASETQAIAAELERYNNEIEACKQTIDPLYLNDLSQQALKLVVDGLRNGTNALISASSALQVHEAKLRQVLDGVLLLPDGPQSVSTQISGLTLDVNALNADVRKLDTEKRSLEASIRDVDLEIQNATVRINNAIASMETLGNAEAMQREHRRRWIEVRDSTVLLLRKNLSEYMDEAAHTVVRNVTECAFEDAQGGLLTSTVHAMCKDLYDTVVAVGVRAKAPLDEFATVSADIRASEELSKTTTARIIELQQLNEADEGKKKKLNTLRTIAEVFSRPGLPKRFINHKFVQIVNLSTVMLDTLGADFVIRVSDRESVSFDFARVVSGEEELKWLPQRKMSGGQRVRTTIPVLMAIQQLVIPEFGLLVLDEPSLHLNAEAVEGLRDLFLEVGPRMAGNESQLIFSDHNPILQTAASSCSIHLRGPA